MKTKLKSLFDFKNVNNVTVLNIISVFLLQGITFFTAPLFTRLLGKEQYGLLSVYGSWVSILTCIMGFNVASSLATAKYRFDDYYRYRSSVLLLGTIISGAMVALGIIFRHPIAEMMGMRGHETEIAVLMLVAAFSNFVSSFAQNAFIYEKKAHINFLYSVAITVCSTGFALFLVYTGDPSERYFTKILGSVIPVTVAAAVMWCVLFFKRPAAPDRQYWKFALVLGGPLVFHTLSREVLVHSDKLMMQYFNVSDGNIGIYSVFYSLTAVLGTILTALNNSWCPFYYDDLNDRAFDKLKKKCSNYLELFTVLTCGFILLSREVGRLYAGEEYYSGIGVFPILALAIYFTLMYQFPVNYEFFHKKTYIAAIGTAGAALTNIGLNALLIPMDGPLGGIMGAAIATALSYFALFAVHMIIVVKMKEKFHMSFATFLPGLAAVLVCAVMFYVLEDQWYIRWPLGAVLGIAELVRIFKRKSIF